MSPTILYINSKNELIRPEQKILKADADEIIVVVPGEDVILTSVALPKLSHNRLMQAVPFTLEEKLISDIALLHFAIGPYVPKQNLPVAIVAKQKMQAWIELLTAENISPTALLPMTYVLPYIEHNLYAILFDETCCVRTGKWSGFTCDRHNLKAFLQIHLSHCPDPPEMFYLYNVSKTSADLKGLSVPINEKKVTAEELHTTCEWVRGPGVINLLQGEYQSTKRSSASKTTWRYSLVLVIVLVFVSLISQLVSLFMLKQSVNTMDVAIQKIYKRNFKNATTVVAPRERMETKLKKILVDTDDFINTFSTIGTQLSKAQGIQLQRLDYRNNHFNLSVMAPNFEALDAFDQGLKKAHFQVKQENAGLDEKQIKANLIISQGGL